MQKNNEPNAKLPIYAKETYNQLYNNKKMANLFDKSWWLTIITLGNYKNLVESLLKDINGGANVLQMGATFGSQIEDTAYKIGPRGKLKVIDVRKSQLKRCENKYSYLLTNLQIENADAETFISEEKYDAVICYNILHELPPVAKTNVINNALELLAPKGKAIFIEYNNPHKWYPLRYFMRMFNRLYQPFAEKIWEREISTYAANRTKYNWKKVILWGGVYQKVIATKKNSSLT